VRDLNEKERAKPEGHLAPLDTVKAAIREVVREELAALRGEKERLMDVDEAAQRLGLSASTIYKLASRSDALASVKIGGRLLFKPSDLDAYAEARRRSPERVRKLASQS